MISGFALSLLKEWYSRSFWLGIVLALMGLAVYMGGHLEASTVYPTGPVSWFLSVIGLAIFSVYFYSHAQWIGEAVGHYKEIDREEKIIRLVKVFLFFLLMSFLTYLLVKSGLLYIGILLWLLIMFYPVSVVLDNVSEVDNVLSTLDVWRRDPSAVLEILLLSSLMLLTAFFLEVNLGNVGYIVSVIVTVGFVVPMTTTMLSLAYLLKYPLTRRALEV